MRMDKIDNAINYIKKLIIKLIPSAIVTVAELETYRYHFDIEIQDRKQKIIFSRSMMEDFEIAINQYAETDYYYTLESAINFTIYRELGKEGLLKDFIISNEIINEMRDWLKNYRVSVVFDAHMTNVLYKGLADMATHFNTLLKKHADLDLTEVKKHMEYTQSLIDYYNENKNLNSKGASIESLQYLKTAAVTQILSLEARRRNEKNISIILAIDKEIYYITEQLRKDPFLGIKLPYFVHDLKARYEE